MTCGTMENHTRSTQFAPAARSPSSAFKSAFSTTSKNILPSAPTVWIDTAMIAGTAPIVRTARKNPAITISGKARRISMKRRTKKRSQRRVVMLEAARKHNTNPQPKPIRVETSAILMVSSIL